MYAQSTSFNQTFSGSTKQRFEGFGLNYFNTNIWDVTSLDATFRDATAYVRNGRPAVIEVNCYRLNSHSKGDDNRNSDEIKTFKDKDLLNLYEREFSSEAEKIKNEVLEELNSILLEVEQEITLNDVSKISKVQNNITKISELKLEISDSRLNEIIYKSLRDYFSEDEDVVLLGEDVECTTSFTSGEYGGAFKVTKNLSEIFKGRVKNTPISEAGITGFAIGMALQKRKSIVEIMFGDFVTLTIDQIIQHASKFSMMFKENLEIPLILRTPMGGRRGYGPTHSQSLEKLFLGIPNVYVLALNIRILSRELLVDIYRRVKSPTIIIENKVDYTRKINEPYIKTHEYFKTDEEYPTVLIKPINLESEVTIFTYGGNLHDVEKAAEVLYLEYEIAVEIICPLKISPIDLAPTLASVKHTKNLLTVEEGSSFGGVGSEIIAQLLGENVPINKVVQIGNENIIPSSYSAEINLLPSASIVVQKVLNMLQ
jgi:2-oxoisovalerate dehydrogenase E1 component